MTDPIPTALVERMRETAKDVRAKWELRTCIEIGRDVRRRVQGLLITPEEHGDLENAIALALARAFLDGQREGLKEAAELAATCGASSFYIASDAVDDIVERLHIAAKRCEGESK